jgi:hypothetical protein
MATSSGGAGSWWVGENLTDQNLFRLGNFFSNDAPSGYQQVQAGNASDAAAFAKSLSSGKPTPNLHGISWQIVGGPFTTQALAKADIAPVQAKKPAPGEVAQVANSLFSIGGVSGTNLAIRAAKVFGGAIILFIGLAKLTGVGGIAAKVVKAAPLL